MRLHRAPVAHLDEIEIMGVSVRQRQRDPAMSERDETLDRGLDRRFEVGIDPCVPR